MESTVTVKFDPTDLQLIVDYITKLEERVEALEDIFKPFRFYIDETAVLRGEDEDYCEICGGECDSDRV